MPEIKDPTLLEKLNAGRPASRPQTSVQPIIATPDTSGDLRDTIAAQGAGNDEIRTGIAVRGEGREADKTAFSQKDTLATRYSNDPTVKSYRVAITELSKALKTGEGPQADLALTYAFAKAMDPDSVVREAEQGMIANSQPWLQASAEAVKKQFGMDGAGSYTPEARKQIRAQIASAVAERNKLYNARRDYYTEVSARNNFDPYEIVGDHDGKPFLPDFTEYDKRNRVGRFADTPEGINMVGGVPEGSEIQFGGGGDNGGFDRDAWLEQKLGWTPTQEAIYIDLLNRNAGKKLSGESLMKLAASYGVPMDKLTVEDFNRDAAKLPNGGTWSPQKPQEQIDWENRVEQLKREREGAVFDPIIRGAADTVSVGLADKGAALMDTVFDGGTYQGNLNEQYAINAADEAVNPYLRTGGQIAGAFALPMGAAKTPAQLGKVGAAYGGAYEFNKSNEDFTDRLDNVAFGAGLGGAAGFGGGKAGQYIANKFPARAGQPSEATEFIDAAARQNIDYLPADIPGATGTKIVTGVAKQSLGGPLITRGADKATESVETAVSRTVDNMGGAAKDPTGAGQAVQSGVRQWQTQADKRVTALEEAIPIKPNTNAVIRNGVSALEDIQGNFSSNPELAAVMSDGKLSKYLSALRGREEDKAIGLLDAQGNPITRTEKFGGSLSYSDLRAFRSEVGEMLGRPTFQSDISQKKLKALYGGLTRDIEETATAAGPNAVKAFQRANNFKRGVETRRENVMQLLLGKDLNMSAEKTFQQIERWSSAKGGDFAKLSQAVRSLPEEEANYVRATILDGLGTANKGAQNATGDAFSINTLVSNWNGLSDRAKATLFHGEHRKAIDDIMTAADGMKASARYNNSSNTGAAVVGTATLSSFAAGVLPGIATVVGQTGAGALLGSPRVAKWLAALYRKPNPQAAKAHVMRLDNLAKSEPFVGAEIIQMKDYLLKQLAETPQRAAAEDRQQSPQSSATTNTPQVGQ